MGTNSPSYGCWSVLPEEILEIILSRLDLADHIRFGSVCKQWRSIAVENTAANKPFCLVRSSDSIRLIYRLLGSVTQDLSICRQWVHARFYLGVKRWLVLMIQPELENRRQLILLNPSLRMAPILLPSLPTWSSTSVRKVVLSSPPDELSADKSTIVFMDAFGYMGFCRLGDTDWTRISERYSLGKDMLFYKEQLYVIDILGLLIVFDSGLNSAPTHFLNFPWWSESFLLNSSDKMLLLHITYPNMTCLNRDSESNPCLSKAFEIDLMGIPSYIEMESLGDDKILFVSSHCALCLPAKENSEFRPNHIYSPDDLPVYSASLDLKMLKQIYDIRNPIFFDLFRRAGFRKMDEGK